MSLLLSGKIPPQFGLGSSRYWGSAQGQDSAEHSGPLSLGALRTPSTGQTFLYFILQRAWVEVAQGPGVLLASD